MPALSVENFNSVTTAISADDPVVAVLKHITGVAPCLQSFPDYFKAENAEALMTNFGKVLALALLFVLGVGTQAHATTLGPTPYSTFAADSPFASVPFSYFFLEDFDDHLLNTLGVSVSPAGVVTSANSGFNGSIIDQVGLAGGCAAGGLSVACDTLFGSGAAGFTFTFSSALLGALPTHAGIVWTDGDGTTSFTAFAPDSTTVVCSAGPVAIADGSFFGTTGEDRFFGCSNPSGISKIFISNTSGGIEVDHLQYGRERETAPGVPEPSSLLLVGSGLVGLVVARRRQRV